MAEHTSSVRWVFDMPPASRARRGGDPSVHAFSASVATLVREVVQNSNDQAIAQPSVVFRLIELEGHALADFLEALGIESLRPHLEAAAAEPERGAALRAALGELVEQGRLRLLVIEDRGTVGLTGAEAEDEGHFAALCRDTLFSHKRTEGAGGSYGLGKSLMWSFSGLGTVLFLSGLSVEAPGQHSPRFIARAELPAHLLEAPARPWGEPQGERAGHWYSGQGWLGVATDTARGPRAESVWAGEAAALGERLHLGRPPQVPGTSIGIVGFRDPTSDLDLDAQRSLGAMATAAVENFWPAMARTAEPLRIGTALGATEAPRWLDPAALPELRPFVRCVRMAEGAGGALRDPGDVARVDVVFELPARRDDPERRSAILGRATLLVTLADDEAAPFANHVAMFRGPGMVVRYWSRRLPLGARPFFAVLLCGHARSAFLEDAEAADDDVEAFLRAAEPPGHDRWESTAALKNRYKRGYRKAIDGLHRAVEHALKGLVVAEPLAGRRGPDRLRRRFPVPSAQARPASAGRLESPFEFEDVTVTWAGLRWSFFGRIRPLDASEARWQARIRLRPVAEDGQRLDAVLPIEVFDADGQHRIDERGEVVLEATGDAVIEFSGESSEALEGEVELEVRGEQLRLGG